MAVSYTPSHPDFFVEFKSGKFTSFLKTRRAFAEGDTLTVLRNLTRGPKAYSTIQCHRGPGDNVELNSDFIFVNHSCEPNIVFDLSSTDPGKWHVRALKNIEAGSAEWEMEQAFECHCGTENCLGRIQGAKYLTREEVLKYGGWASPWILELIENKERFEAQRVDEPIGYRADEADSQEMINNA